jgi:CMP-N,N'-diacetyllegionaminic acid synthase
MYKGKSVLAIVPARGGSKGIKLKNLARVGGESLIQWVGRFIKDCNKSKIIDMAIVSTDHEDIAKAARAVEIQTPFVRPHQLSGDYVSDIEVLTHALIEAEKATAQEFDIVVMLQPTCPFRRTQHLTDALEKLIKEDLESVVTVSEGDSKHHPLKQLKISRGMLTYLDQGGKDIIARQQLEPLFYRNGAVYVLTRECVLKRKETIGPNTGALVCNEKLVNIDTPDDLLYANFLVEAGLIESELA